MKRPASSIERLEAPMPLVFTPDWIPTTAANSQLLALTPVIPAAAKSYADEVPQ